MTAKLELTDLAPINEIRSVHFIRSQRLGAQQLPAILTGPVVTDALGIPRYAATIWIDFLHGDLAVQTRSAYRRAAAALYDQAAQCAPAVDLDLALLSPNLSEVERVLSAFLLSLQIKSGIATSAQWRLARSFVFDFLRFSEVDTDTMRKRLLEIEQRFRRLRPQAPRPPAPVRALPAEVIEDLHEIFHPSSQRNPYRTEPIRWRNFTIFMLLLHLGLRAGELLSLTAGAIKSEFSHATGAEAFWIDVEIDDRLVDDRARPASLKNANATRQLPLPPELADLCALYLTNFRGDPPHGFLFTSQEGRPLSDRTLGQIFSNAQACLTLPAIDALARRHRGNLSPHDLRHTSAVVRLQRYRNAGLSQDEAIERLRPFFGWARDSEMPLLYARAYFEPRFQDVWDECFTNALEALRTGLGRKADAR